MRSLSTAARTRAPNRVYSIPSTSAIVIEKRETEQNQPVDRKAQAHERERGAQIGWQLQRLLVGTEEVSRDRDGNKDNADGQQYLIELAGAVQAAKERVLERDADHRGGDERTGQRGEKRHAVPVHQSDSDVAAKHREAAMREVDEIHHAERHRLSDRQQKQQHAVSKAVEQNAKNGRKHRRLAPMDRRTT